jgi:hypothetical protein
MMRYEESLWIFITTYSAQIIVCIPIITRSNKAIYWGYISQIWISVIYREKIIINTVIINL